MECAVSREVGVRLPEGFLPILQIQMKCRRDDMARQFVAKLDDVLAKIGFDRRDSVRLQVVVDGDLLADH